MENKDSIDWWVGEEHHVVYGTQKSIQCLRDTILNLIRNKESNEVIESLEMSCCFYNPIMDHRTDRKIVCITGLGDHSNNGGDNNFLIVSECYP